MGTTENVCGAGGTEVRTKSKVEALMDTIAGEINGLGEIRNTLEVRLAVVLGRADPQPTKDEDKKELIGSPAVLSLTNIRDALACEIGRIADIIARLEI